MNIQTINTDIKNLKAALKLIEKTDNYLHFTKATLISTISEQINVLKERSYKPLNIYYNNL